MLPKIIVTLKPPRFQEFNSQWQSKLYSATTAN